MSAFIAHNETSRKGKVDNEGNAAKGLFTGLAGSFVLYGAYRYIGIKKLPDLCKVRSKAYIATSL